MVFSIFLATFLSSFISLVGAFVLASREKWSQPFSLHLTALSSGVLLATALLHLAPEAAEELNGEPSAIFMTMFIGIIIFFLIERLMLWYHHHHEASQLQPSAFLIMIGDSIHNFIDGVTVAATMLANPALGIVTAIAVATHEIPQEIADFAVMVNGGMSRKKALLFNIISACAAFIGAGLMIIFQDVLLNYLPYAVGFSAGMFLYIALSDLIPELHHHKSNETEKWTQLLWFFGGIIVLVILSSIFHES